MTTTDSCEFPGVVLLAAGGSVRLGQAKQLLRIEGEALVRRRARSLLKLGPASLVVVTGCQSDEVGEQLDGLPVQIVFNPNWQQGMGSSIAVGVKNLPAEVKGAMIVLCDQWRVTEADLKRLILAWNSDISGIVSSHWNEDNSYIFGAPAIFSGNIFRELICLSGDQGAKQVIQNNKDRTRFVTVENARFDLDEPGDLQQLPKGG